MSNMIMILGVVFLSCVQNICKKQYTLKYNFGVLTFNAICTLFAFFFFLIVGGSLEWNWTYFPYSALYGVVYAVSMNALHMAITNGSLAITSLVLAYSLVIPALYGLFVLKEQVGVAQYFGMVLVLISLYLVRGVKEKEYSVKVTYKWIIYTILAFLGNGMCAVLQKEQQRVLGGVYDNSFMVFALGIAALLQIFAAILSERKEVSTVIKCGGALAGIFGISNGIINYLLLLLMAVAATSVTFPAISAGQLVGAFLVSVILYKEKFAFRQLIGFICGVATLILLNL